MHIAPHQMLEEVDEPVMMELAARTLGRLVKSGAARTSDIVDKEVREMLAPRTLLTRR